MKKKLVAMLLVGSMALSFTACGSSPKSGNNSEASTDQSSDDGEELKAEKNLLIGRSITPHTLRHTHASLLMEQGIDIDSISKRLGHNDSKVTREIYLHVTQKLESKRNEQLKELKIL